VAQLLVHLPEELILRLKRAIPSRQRSQFVQLLIEAALPAEADDALYNTALAVERDEALTAEMAEWAEATVADGLEPRR
jgi:hypothetical protein